MQTIQKGVGGTVWYDVQGGVPSSPYARLVDAGGVTKVDWTAVDPVFSCDVKTVTEGDDDLYSLKLDLAVGQTIPAAIKLRRIRVELDSGPPEWPVVESIDTDTIAVRMPTGLTPVSVSQQRLSYSVSADYCGSPEQGWHVDFRWSEAEGDKSAQTWFAIVLQPMLMDLSLGAFLDHYPEYRSWAREVYTPSAWYRLLETAADLVEIELCRHGQRPWCVAGADSLRLLLVGALRLLLVEGGNVPKIGAQDPLGFLEAERARFGKLGTDTLRNAYLDPVQSGVAKTTIRPRVMLRTR